MQAGATLHLKKFAKEATIEISVINAGLIEGLKNAYRMKGEYSFTSRLLQTITNILLRKKYDPLKLVHDRNTVPNVDNDNIHTSATERV